MIIPDKFNLEVSLNVQSALMLGAVILASVVLASLTTMGITMAIKR